MVEKMCIFIELVKKPCFAGNYLLLSELNEFIA